MMDNRSNQVVLSNQTFIHLRGWAILGVLVIHATGPAIALMANPIPSLYPAIILNQLSRYCVPMFFFISAYLYTKKFDSSFNYSDFIKRRFKTVGVPYLVWSLFYLTMRIMTGSIPLSDFDISFVTETLLKGTGYGHLYFIPAVFQFYIFLPFIIKFWQKLRANTYRSVLFFICFCIALVVYQLRITNLGSGIGHLLIGSDYILIWWLPFIFLGIEWASRPMDIRSTYKPYLYIALIIVIVLMNYEFIAQYKHWPYYYSFDMIGVSCGEMATFLRPSAFVYGLLSILLLTYAVHVRKVHGTGLTIIGKYSFGIYLMHPFLNKCVISAMNIISMPYSPWIILVAGTGLSITFVHVLSKIRGTEYIIGPIR